MTLSLSTCGKNNQNSQIQQKKPVLKQAVRLDLQTILDENVTKEAIGFHNACGAIFDRKFYSHPPIAVPDPCPLKLN